MRTHPFALAMLAACAPALPGPQPLDLRDALVTTPQPAIAAPGTCWGTAAIAGQPQVWFRAPCPEDLTPAFLGTLQRALQVRGAFAGQVTSRADAATAMAIRRFQAPRGLDSDVLALATAQALGVAVTPLE
jgi:hypothetical protein